MTTITKIDQLKEEFKSLIGRDVEFEKVKDGIIVLYINTNKGPPPVGSSEEDALEKFITYFKETQNASNGT